LTVTAVAAGNRAASAQFARDPFGPICQVLPRKRFSQLGHKPSGKKHYGPIF